MSSGSVAILFTGTPASDANLLALDDPQWHKPSPSNYVIAIAPARTGEASSTEEVDANGNVTLNFLPIIER